MWRRNRARPWALALAALGLGVATVGGRGRKLDDALFRTLNAGLRHPVLDAGFRAVTEAGSLWAVGAAAGTLAARRRGREGADALAAAMVTWLAGQGLKRAFRRLRPYEVQDSAARLLIGKPAGTSWPSSHPAVLATFAIVAARDLGIEGGSYRGLEALVGLVALSRVDLGVHDPADVAGGLLIGRAIADVWSAEVSPRVLR